MAKLKEQGTVSDLPMQISRKLYFVREEDGMVSDHGWVTVDEARRNNSADRREFGATQNRYFIDQPSADSYMTTVQSGATGFEPPPEIPGGLPPGPEGEMGPGLEPAGGPPGGEPFPGPEGPGGPEGFPGPEELPGPEEGSDLAGDLDGLLGDEEPGEVPVEELGGEDTPLGPEEEEEKEIEFIVPRRVRLRVEGSRKPPWERHPKSAKNQSESRYCPQCRSDQSFADDVCDHCHVYSAKPQENDQGSETTEAGIVEALLDGDINIRQVLEQDWQLPGLEPVDLVQDVGTQRPGAAGVSGGVYVVDHFKGEMYGPYSSEDEAERANQPLGRRELVTDVTDLVDQGYELLSPYEEGCPPLSKIRPGSKGISKSAKKKRKSKGESLPSFEEMVEDNLNELGRPPRGGRLGRLARGAAAGLGIGAAALGGAQHGAERPRPPVAQQPGQEEPVELYQRNAGSPLQLGREEPVELELAPGEPGSPLALRQKARSARPRGVRPGLPQARRQ